MKRFVLSTFLATTLPVVSFAQFDSIVNAFQKEFEQFQQSVIREHQRFISHNDSVFLNFLKES